MGRKRIYANDTERQRAWRERLKAQASGSMPALLLPQTRRPPSRPARLATLLTNVQQLQREYEHWLKRLPDSLAETELAQRLEGAIDQLQAVANLLAEIDLPRGFGRD
jgi:hypothetical protein